MKTMSELWKIISRNGLKPLPKTSVSEWADCYRFLSGGAEPGRWKTSRAEYQREIMNAFTQPGVHRVVVMSASQIGKSDIMNNVIGRFAHLDPAAIMMVQPTIDMAEDFSKSRIAPMIRDTKVLNRLFFDVKSRNSNNTILSKIFPGGRLVMCGSNSPAGLASRPIRILLADEIDRFDSSAGTEGDPIDLAAKRMSTFWNRVSGLFSTPTNKGSSRIEKEYLLGTQEEWQHQCPNCSEYHLINHRDINCDYEQIKGKDEEKNIFIKSIKWRCPDCGYEFDENTIKKSPAKYIAQNLRAMENGVRSFFVNAFASPWLSWREIMKEWLDAQGDPEREKVVVNTRFGETYAQVGAFENEQIFLNRREKYGAELPEGVLMLTAAVDTQDNRLEYEIKGWGTGEECWGIKKGIILGMPDQPGTWKELDGVLDKIYYFADGRGLKILRTFIDSGGHYSGEVYNYCYLNFVKQRFAIKGQGGAGIPLNKKIGKATGYNIPLVILGVNDGKQQIMNRLSIEEVGFGYCHFPLDETGLTNRGYDDFYFKGLISERKKLIKKLGQIQEVWEPIREHIRNEPLDLSVYNLACMRSLNPNWEKLKELLTGESIKSAATVEKTSSRTIKKSKSVDIW